MGRRDGFHGVRWSADWEQVSSVDAQRPQLKAALDYLREGDVFVVTKPDRLARSTRDLLDIVEGLQARGVDVRILSMNLDTSTPTGKLILRLCQSKSAQLSEAHCNGGQAAQPDTTRPKRRHGEA